VRPAEVVRSFAGHVFVCGLHRSGTTLVETLIHSACEVAVLRAEVSENEGQHLQDVYPRAVEHGGAGRFAFAPEMHATGVDGDAAALRNRLLACWSPWVVGAEPVLLEKSPPNLLRIGWLREVFPGARFVIVTRDPRAVAAATAKWSGTSVAELVYHWHVAHAAVRAQMGDDCVHLRYEDICDDPQGAVERVMAVAGLSRRAEALPLPTRFAQLKNSNAAYLGTLPNMHFGPGAWEDFGYRLA